MGRLEWANSYTTAQRVGHDGWAWRLTPPRSLNPACPPPECCSRMPLGGGRDCFDSVFNTFSRCCIKSPILSVVPDSRVSRLPRCWHLVKLPKDSLHAIACVGKVHE